MPRRHARAVCLVRPAMWPGVRCAGLPRLSGGADAGPAAPQAPRLIIGGLLVSDIEGQADDDNRVGEA